MNGKKVSTKMIAQMSKQSMKSSRMRNIFVMVTIVLASALLTAILMFAAGQREQNARQLSHAQQVGYFNLSDSQVETLKADERIAGHFQKADHLVTGEAVQISCGLICQNNGRFRN